MKKKRAGASKRLGKDEKRKVNHALASGGKITHFSPFFTNALMSGVARRKAKEEKKTL